MFLLHTPRWNLSVRSEGVGPLLHAPYWNLSDRSLGGKFFLNVVLGVSPTHPVLESVRSFVGWEVFVTRQVRGLSYTPIAEICLAIQLVGSLSYTPRAEICLVVRRVRSLSYSLGAGICQVVRYVRSVS